MTTETITEPKMTKREWEKLTQKQKSDYEASMRAYLIANGSIKPVIEPEKPIRIKMQATGE
jgi:uncharacterized protein YeeX (DUF496 family)